MNKKCVLTMALLAVTSGMVLADGPGQSTSATLNRKIRDRESIRGQQDRSLVQEWLDQKVESVSFDETPFEDVIRWLRERPGEINIFVDWRAIEGLGVDREALITLELKNVPLYKIIDFVLREAGADVPLGYKGTDNILTITVQDALDAPENFVIRTYSLTDLISRKVNFDNAPSIRLSNLQERESGGGGGGSSLFSDDDDDDEEEDLEARVQVVIDSITQTIEPSTWTVNGGLGTVSAVNDVIIVNNSLSVHEQIGGPVRLQPNRSQ